MNHWDQRFLDIAQIVATWSKDRSRLVGCVLVKDRRIIATGFNGFPRGVVEFEHRQGRPAKYLWTEHAERNAIYNAAFHGMSTECCTAYAATLLASDKTSAPLHVCADCARALIQAGIERVVCGAPNFEDPNFGEQFRASETMLREAGVKVEYYK